MSDQSIIHIILEVLKDPRVIVAAVVCLIAMDLSCYVVRYRKKPKIKRPKASSQPKPAAQKTDAASAGQEGEGAQASSANSAAAAKSSSAASSK